MNHYKMKTPLIVTIILNSKNTIKMFKNNQYYQILKIMKAFSSKTMTHFLLIIKKEIYLNKIIIINKNLSKIVTSKALLTKAQQKTIAFRISHQKNPLLPKIQKIMPYKRKSNKMIRVINPYREVSASKNLQYYQVKVEIIREMSQIASLLKKRTQCSRINIRKQSKIN